MARVPMTPQEATMSTLRREGDALLEERQRRHEQRVELQAVKDRFKKIEGDVSTAEAKIESLQMGIERLKDGIGKMSIRAGGGRRMVAKILGRDFPATTTTPQSLVPPVISAANNLLTRVPGLWLGGPPVTWRWDRDGAPIPNSENVSSYTVVETDEGVDITILETAVYAGQPLTARSAPYSVPTPEPANVTPPSILHPVTAGAVFTRVPGDWTSWPDVTWVWLRDGDEIAGSENDETYTLVVGDVDAYISLRETAEYPDATVLTADSSAIFGPVVSSTFSPLDFFTADDGGLWFPAIAGLYRDAAGTDAVALDNDPIGFATDATDNDNHGTQPTLSMRPQYNTDGEFEWMQFDGVDDRLETSIVPELAGSLIVWVKPDEATGNFMGSSVGFNAGRLQLGTGTAGQLQVALGSLGAGAFEDAAAINRVGSYVMAGMTWAGAGLTAKLYADGVVVASMAQTGEVNTTLPVYIGAVNFAGEGYSFGNCSIRMAMWIDRQLTDNEMAQINAWATNVKVSA